MAVCSIQQTSAPMDVAFDLSENGRKLAHATSSVCSKPTGELGSYYEGEMSPQGSDTKGIDEETRKTCHLNQPVKGDKKSFHSKYF